MRVLKTRSHLKLSIYGDICWYCSTSHKWQRPMDGLTDQLMVGLTYQPMDRWTDGWTDIPQLTLNDLK